MELVFVVLFTLFIILMIVLYDNYKLRRKMHSLSEARKWYRMAYQDGLTGLNNRAAYNQRMDELKTGKRRGQMGIILFDIDNFKIINDTQGHLAGDRVLQMVSAVLSEIFSSSLYTLYRIGGDEFAVICERVMEQDIIDILLLVRNHFAQEGDIRLSKGYSMIEKDVLKAFSDADKMLYIDKTAKKVRTKRL